MKWFSLAKETFWGDGVDLRFLATFLLKSYKNKQILDIGCNKGIVLSEIDRTNKIFGLDLSGEFLKTARTLNNQAGFVETDMQALPFKNGSFDLVILLGMLEVPVSKNKAECLLEISRVLRDGGELLIATHNKKALLGKHNYSHLDYAALKQLVSKDFEFKILGFNPFPNFPFFLPNFILQNLPFIWWILFLMMKNNILLDRCRSFLVTARKK